MAYTDFNGWLFGAVATQEEITANIDIDTVGTVKIKMFPDKYIKENSYNSNPDQREEIDAWRDDYSRDLYRITAAGKKSIFEFTTRDNLHLKQIDEIQKFFTTHETSAQERKIQLYFWNMDTMTYDNGFFYRPNMPFPIKGISNKDIRFGELKFEFAEY